MYKTERDNCERDLAGREAKQDQDSKPKEKESPLKEGVKSFNATQDWDR